MSDLLEHDLRGALADQAALMTPEASARLQAVDYHPRTRSLRSWPALGGVGLTATAAAAAAILLGSSAAPAFAGWTANPTTPHPGQLAAAQQACGAGSGTPVLTDTRGPYTASVYADGSTCVQGKGTTIGSKRGGGGMPSAAAGTIELNGFGESDSAGNALTMVEGPIGAGVTGVTITRSDGSSVQATVRNGWYMAWWPGKERAMTAQVTSTSATSTQTFPAPPDQASPSCPAGAHCSSAYGFGSAPGHGGQSSTRIGSSSNVR